MLIHCWTEHRLLRTSNLLAEICNDIFFNIVFLSHFKTKEIESVYLINKRFGTLFILWWGQRNPTNTTYTRAVVQVKWEDEIW